MDGDAPIEVLLVDDSVVVRHFVQDVLRGENGIEVAATAANGLQALERLEEHRVDVVVLDIEMPVLDGLATLARLRARWPRLPVIMFSTLTERGAAATLDALALGASDYVTKPTQLRDRQAARTAVVDGLLPLLRTWGRINQLRRGGGEHRRDGGGAPPGGPAAVVAPARPAPAPLRRVPGGPRAVEAVLIGASTGGPNALTEIVPSLPATLGVPVLVVQHMPTLFTRLLAERLDDRSALRVEESVSGRAVRPGHVYIAAGGVHMAVRRQDGLVELQDDDGPPEHSVKPAVDVLFRSAVAVWGGALLAVVLTGMGNDGMLGARQVVDAGGTVLAQDEATSVVWGMPGAVVRGGLAHEVLPLDRVASAIVQRVGVAEVVG